MADELWLTVKGGAPAVGCGSTSYVLNLGLLLLEVQDLYPSCPPADVRRWVWEARLDRPGSLALASGRTPTRGLAEAGATVWARDLTRLMTVVLEADALTRCPRCAQRPDELTGRCPCGETGV